MTLPAGLTLRMGRHFANIGYLNEKHAHSWDFADQPLPYQPSSVGNIWMTVLACAGWRPLTCTWNSAVKSTVAPTILLVAQAVPASVAMQCMPVPAAT